MCAMESQRRSTDILNTFKAIEMFTSRFDSKSETDFAAPEHHVYNSNEPYFSITFLLCGIGSFLLLFLSNCSLEELVEILLIKLHIC